MKIRTPSQLLDSWELATKENPLVIKDGEYDNFIKAMKISQASSDQKISPNKISIVDKDVLLKDGVKSTVDGKKYSNRREWNEHLKRNHCVEIGNDYNNHTPAPPAGDHNVRSDLINAMKQKGAL